MALAAASPPAVAAGSIHCVADNPSDHWGMIRWVLEPAALNGPPEMKEAVTALLRDNRELALQLLDRAGRCYPSDVALREPFYPPFLNAVLSAQTIAWQLRGCPLTPDGVPTLFFE